MGMKKMTNCRTNWEMILYWDFYQDNEQWKCFSWQWSKVEGKDCLSFLLLDDKERPIENTNGLTPPSLIYNGESGNPAQVTP